MRPTFVVLVLACVVRCVSPSASERPSRDVVSAETVSQLHVAPHGVVPELFEAAHELLASGDATGALRVLVLCRRLAGADANIELAAAGIRCRAGDLPAAHAGFRLARVLAGQLCPEDAKEGQGCPDADRRQALELMLATSARHGMCLMEARMFAYAAARFRDALAIDQVALRVRRAWLRTHRCRDWTGDEEGHAVGLFYIYGALESGQSREDGASFQGERLSEFSGS
jgi:hypothetical protein